MFLFLFQGNSLITNLTFGGIMSQITLKSNDPVQLKVGDPVLDIEGGDFHKQVNEMIAKGYKIISIQPFADMIDKTTICLHVQVDLKR